MASFDELIKSLHGDGNETETSLQDSNGIIQVDVETRDFIIPDNYNTTLAYSGDVNSQIVTFQIPPTHEQHYLLGCKNKKIKWKNLASGYEDINNLEQMEEGSEILSWHVPPEAFSAAGVLEFSISFYDLLDDGRIGFSWNTPSCTKLSIGEAFEQVSSYKLQEYIPAKNEILTIDDNKQIVAPKGYNNVVANYGDKNSSAVYFQCQRYYKGFDLLDPNLTVEVVVAINGFSFSEEISVKNRKQNFVNKEETGGLVTLIWKVSPNITNNSEYYVGNFSICIRFAIQGQKQLTTNIYSNLTIGNTLMNDYILPEERPELLEGKANISYNTVVDNTISTEIGPVDIEFFQIDNPEPGIYSIEFDLDANLEIFSRDPLWWGIYGENLDGSRVLLDSMESLEEGLNIKYLTLQSSEPYVKILGVIDHSDYYHSVLANISLMIYRGHFSGWQLDEKLKYSIPFYYHSIKDFNNAYPGDIDGDGLITDLDKTIFQEKLKHKQLPVGAPVQKWDATNKEYVDSQLERKINKPTLPDSSEILGISSGGSVFTQKFTSSPDKPITGRNRALVQYARIFKGGTGSTPVSNASFAVSNPINNYNPATKNYVDSNFIPIKKDLKIIKAATKGQLYNTDVETYDSMLLPFGDDTLPLIYLNKLGPLMSDGAYVDAFVDLTTKLVKLPSDVASKISVRFSDGVYTINGTTETPINIATLDYSQVSEGDLRYEIEVVGGSIDYFTNSEKKLQLSITSASGVKKILNVLETDIEQQNIVQTENFQSEVDDQESLTLNEQNTLVRYNDFSFKIRLVYQIPGVTGTALGQIDLLRANLFDPVVAFGNRPQYSVDEETNTFIQTGGDSTGIGNENYWLPQGIYDVYVFGDAGAHVQFNIASDVGTGKMIPTSDNLPYNTIAMYKSGPVNIKIPSSYAGLRTQLMIVKRKSSENLGQPELGEWGSFTFSKFNKKPLLNFSKFLEVKVVGEQTSEVPLFSLAYNSEIYNYIDIEKRTLNCSVIQRKGRIELLDQSVEIDISNLLEVFDGEIDLNTYSSDSTKHVFFRPANQDDYLVQNDVPSEFMVIERVI